MFDDDGASSPYVIALTGTRDPRTFKRVVRAGPGDESRPSRSSPQAIRIELFGLIPTDRHLIGVEGAKPGEPIFLLGTDLLGRDLWSRLIVRARGCR